MFVGIHQEDIWEEGLGLASSWWGGEPRSGVRLLDLHRTLAEIEGMDVGLLGPWTWVPNQGAYPGDCE